MNIDKETAEELEHRMEILAEMLLKAELREAAYEKAADAAAETFKDDPAVELQKQAINKTKVSHATADKSFNNKNNKE